MLLEFERALHDLARNTRSRFDRAARLELLAMQFFKRRFVIERVHLAHAAVHEKLDHAFGFRRDDGGRPLNAPRLEFEPSAESIWLNASAPNPPPDLQRNSRRENEWCENISMHEHRIRCCSRATRQRLGNPYDPARSLPTLVFSASSREAPEGQPAGQINLRCEVAWNFARNARGKMFALAHSESIVPHRKRLQRCHGIVSRRCELRSIRTIQ